MPPLSYATPQTYASFLSTDLPKNEAVSEAEASVGHLLVEVGAIQLQEVQEREAPDGRDLGVQRGVPVHLLLKV